MATTGYNQLSNGQWMKNDGTGPYIQSTPGVFDPIALSSEWSTTVGFSLATGYERWSLWGNNPDIDTGTLPEIVSPLGGTTPAFVDGLTSMEVVSDSVNDTAAGTGAQTVTFEVLDANYVRSFPTVTLNGTTAVALPAQVTAVNSIFVKTVGSVGSNVGTITVRDTGAGASRMLILPGRNISQAAARVVPAGYTLQIRTHFASINRTVTAGRWITWTGAFQQFVSAGVWDPAILALDAGLSDNSPMFFQAEPGLIIREKGRYWHQAMDVSANNTNLTTASWGILRLN